MTMLSEKCIKSMLEASTKKLELLNEIYELTKQQSEVITENTIEKLLEFIDDKQIKIDSIIELDDVFNTSFDKLKTDMKVKSLDELKIGSIPGLSELKKSIGDILQIANEISNLEKQNNESAKKLIDDIGKEIKKINQGKKLNQLYRPKNAQTVSYYFDKKK